MIIIKSDYDFDTDLHNHRDRVKCFIKKIINQLNYRGNHHDDSKLSDPEYNVYKKFTPILNNCQYKSNEYNQIVNTQEFVDAITHHELNNSHHPEHYHNGVNDMDLVDVIEMLCDWKSASERHQNASWIDGFNINCNQYHIDDQLKSILFNTYENYFKGDN